MNSELVAPRSLENRVEESDESDDLDKLARCRKRVRERVAASDEDGGEEL